jgi:hypothetical protein
VREERSGRRTGVFVAIAVVAALTVIGAAVMNASRSEPAVASPGPEPTHATVSAAPSPDKEPAPTPPALPPSESSEPAPSATAIQPSGPGIKSKPMPTPKATAAPTPTPIPTPTATDKKPIDKGEIL